MVMKMELPKITEYFDLAGKSALITGGTGSLGSEAARALAGAGASVTLAGGNKEAVSSGLSRRSRMLEACLKGWGCCWWLCEGIWVIELCSGASGRGGGAVEVCCGRWVLVFSTMAGVCGMSSLFATGILLAY